ncbi:MAG: hypothetical protein WAM73_17450 [Desulfobacterales bacterium]
MISEAPQPERAKTLLQRERGGLTAQTELGWVGKMPIVGHVGQAPAVVGDTAKGDSGAAGKLKQFCRTALRKAPWPHIEDIDSIRLLVYIQMYT